MSKLTEAAKHQDCQIRLPGICNHTPETTVPCHYRSNSFGAGMGLKPPDLLTAFGCSSCHDVIDGRVHTDLYTREQLDLMFAEGVFRTQLKHLKAGRIKAA